jgi:hypothetical protein
MNIFTGLLFQHGYIANADLAKLLAAPTPSADYGRTCGSHIAIEKTVPCVLKQTPALSGVAAGRTSGSVRGKHRRWAFTHEARSPRV